MHIRCPHCHNAVEVVGNEEFEPVNCPSCGSAFDLALPTKSYWLGRRKIAHFELLDQLGAGGFGTVWKARDTKLDRLVALKVPRIDVHDQEHGDLFLREARAAAQLRHQHIVAVHEVGREDDTLYIVSDFIQGVTLADRLTAGPLTNREAAELLATVAEALHHAHEAGVIHRDLKPQNIMIDADGQPKLMDFGLAKREAGEVTMTIDGKIIGTPAYMSPEQARGEGHSVDRRTDIYSLGVILFELLTGERPFRGNQRMLLHQVIHDEPPNPRKLNSRIPRDLETICLKCLEKQPPKRYSTAQEVAAELRRYLSGEPIHARPISRAEHAWRWAKRNPTVAKLSAAVLAVLLLGIGVSSHFAIRESTRAAAEAKERKRADGEAENALKASALAAQRADDLQRRLVLNDVDRGIGECEAGRVDAGLNYLCRAYGATQSGEPLRDAALTLLAGWGTAGGELRLLHGGPVSAVAFSPDGAIAVTAGSFDSHCLWDASTGRPIGKSFEANPSAGSAGTKTTMLSRDGKRVVSFRGLSSTSTWDASDGKFLGEALEQGGYVNALAFSPDGKLIATGGSDGVARLWDANSYAFIQELEGRAADVTYWHGCVAFSPDSNTLLVGNASDLRRWDVTTGQRLGPPIPAGLAADARIERLAYSPDGQMFVTAGKIAQIWGAASAGPIHKPMQLSSFIKALTFSPDSERLLTLCEDGTLTWWSTSSGEGIRSTKIDSGPMQAAEFSPDARKLLVGLENGGARLLTLPPGPMFSGELPAAESFAIRDASYSDDGGVLSVFSVEKTYGRKFLIDQWDTRTLTRIGEAIRSPDMGSPDLTYAHHFQRKLVINLAPYASDRIWDWATGKAIPLRELEYAPGLKQVEALAISPDGKTLLLGGENLGASNVALWNLETGRIIKELSLNATKLWGAAFSSNGQVAATWSEWKDEDKHNANLTLWDASTGNQVDILTLAGSGKLTAMNADKSTVFTLGRDGSLYRLDASKSAGQEVSLTSDDIPIAVLTSNKSTVLTGYGATDAVVRIWDATTGMPLGQPLGPERQFKSAAIRPGGGVVLTTGVDGAHLWEIVTGKPLGPRIHSDDPGEGVRFSPDGQSFLIWHARKVTLWRMPRPLPDEPERLRAWVEIRTGQYWDQNLLRPLSNTDWLKRWQRLEQLGGPPLL